MIGVGTPGWNCNPPIRDGYEPFAVIDIDKKAKCDGCYYNTLHEAICYGAPCNNGKIVWRWRKRDV
jgi:hypothetical protein